MQDHIKMLATHDEKLNEHEKKLDNFSTLALAVERIAILFEVYQRDADKRNQQIDEQNKILAGINQNITALNKNHDDMQVNISQMDEELADIKCQIANQDEKNFLKIDVRDEAKEKISSRIKKKIPTIATILGSMAFLYEIGKLIGIF
jgi:DNA repair ATPase RecN